MKSGKPRIHRGLEYDDPQEVSQVHIPAKADTDKFIPFYNLNDRLRRLLPAGRDESSATATNASAADPNGPDRAKTCRILPIRAGTCRNVPDFADSCRNVPDLADSAQFGPKRKRA